jgi:alginate O-acetyltransferase complex protein AlgI
LVLTSRRGKPGGPERSSFVVFASKAFFIFLPTVLVLYYLLRRRSHKYGVLLAASWLFYAWLSPQYLWVIVLCTVIDYAAGLKIDGTGDERRRWLWLSIAANIGLLAAFKYTAFAYDNAVSLARLCGAEVADRHWNILLPLGISFHTFQGISYTVDVYRRRIPAVRSFLDYAFFVAFWPQLAAGPIVRAAEFLPQMQTPPRATARQVAEGLHFFLLGLFKKLFIADQLDVLFVTPVFADPGAFDPAARRWACVAWAAQIYCDFSGYSDMAVGCAKWFGFELPRNFNFPYLATSIADFWRRWHLSLSTWLRDYVYFPMGGSRGGATRTYFNLIAVFVLCGLWHGATWAWLVYGLYNGLLMSLHRAYDRAITGIPWADAVRATWAWKLFAWAATFVQLLAGLVLVRMSDWATGWVMLRSLFALDVLAGWSAAIPVWVPLLLLLVAVGHLFSGLRDRVCGLLELPAGVRAAVYVGAVVLLVTLSPGVAKTFIYIQF